MLPPDGTSCVSCRSGLDRSGNSREGIRSRASESSGLNRKFHTLRNSSMKQTAHPHVLFWVLFYRSNGFEQKRFARLASKKAVQELAYKWSVEDM